MVVSASLAAIVASPVAAAYPPWHASTATCYYEADASGERLLAGIVVTPPALYADSGTQTVGWRFVVRRSRNWDEGPWKVRFRSPIETATATQTEPGQFNTYGAAVRVPDVEDKSAIRYHVTLKMLWYAGDGSASVESHRFDHIDWSSGGVSQGNDGYCPASLDTGP